MDVVGGNYGTTYLHKPASVTPLRRTLDSVFRQVPRSAWLNARRFHMAASFHRRRVWRAGDTIAALRGEHRCCSPRGVCNASPLSDGLLCRSCRQQAVLRDCRRLPFVLNWVQASQCCGMTIYLRFVLLCDVSRPRLTWDRLKIVAMKA